jgi:glycosidase
MTISKRFLLCMLSMAAISMMACTENNENGENGGNGGEEPAADIVDKVSQYEAREFDGEKRAGVFYEIFVRSFADSDGDGVGDLNGITAKLDYLDDLGVSGIWLTPIHPSDSYHGYDVIDYKGVKEEYGTMADFERLIAEAHKRDIRVILDYVLNHSSKLNPWFKAACADTESPYRDFYNFTTDNREGWGGWHRVPGGEGWYFGDFDSSMPDLNYGPATSCATNATFLALVDAAKFWIDKGVDGFRLDAVKHIYDNQTSDENPTFLNTFYTTLNQYFQGKSALGYKDLYMVGECWMGHGDMAKYYKGLPALFDFTAWENWMMYAINNSHAKWFPKDIIGAQNTFKQYRSDYIHATKLSNHDENRARTSLGGSVDRAKMAGAILLTSAGSPFIYYGEEIGMKGDKSKGDENVREPMLWAPKAEDAFRTTWMTPKFNNNDLGGTVAGLAEDANSIYNVYRKFMRLRNTYPALAEGTIELPEGFNDSDTANKQVMVFYRQAGSERLLVVHNVSAKQSTHTVKHAIKRPIADMNKVKIESKSDAEHVLTMPAYSSIIIEL